VARAARAAGLRVGVALVLVVGVCGWMSEVAGAVALPDSRAYELVSPPDKNGADVLAYSTRTRAAADGGAVSFASLGGFGDVLGMGVATEYMAVRSSSAVPGNNGWSTHAITPPQRALSAGAILRGMDPLYESDFSPDLSRGVFRAWSLLSDAPNVSNVANLYLRADLRTPGPGSYQLLSDAVAPVGSNVNGLLNGFPLRLTGASADFGHVIFESLYTLTAGAPPFPRTKLYEWDNGTLRLAGVLPEGSAAPVSIAGQGGITRSYPRHTISEAGRRIFFTDPSTGTGGVTGSDGTLYVRETDPATSARTTTQLNSSERTNCADNNSCDGAPEPDPGGPQPARYWDASRDGGRVFFTTLEALTDDAPLNGAVKLYMYDTTKPDSDPHNLTFLSIDSEPDDGGGGSVTGVLGASTDGHYVYFGADSQLVAGAPLNPGSGIYLWHDGTVAYIGSVFFDDMFLDASQDFQFDPAESRVTPDGKHLLFMSTSGLGLTGYDHGSCPDNGTVTSQCRELYVYSAVDGHLSCASCNPSGAAATADASTQARAHGGGTSTTPTVNRAISDDGRRVFFTTREALVPQDTNGRLDAYEYDVPSGAVHLLSTGKDTVDSYFLNASGSGNDVFILTRQRLVGWDRDSAYDLSDVRLGGGFPDPPPPPPSCVGDTCHGTPTGAPDVSTPGTTSVNRLGPHVTTVKSKLKRRPLRCKRGFVRKRVKGKVRCVKRPRKAAKRANAGRGR
jgi:hypothetical protein